MLRAPANKQASHEMLFTPGQIAVRVGGGRDDATRPWCARGLLIAINYLLFTAARGKDASDLGIGGKDFRVTAQKPLRDFPRVSLIIINFQCRSG